MKSIFRYPGSKWGLAPWIISNFPEHYEKMVYLEPFVGSGAVFFNKVPSAVETINDLDSGIYNLFMILRDRPGDLKKALELTPYSREEYDRSFEPSDDPLESARRFMVKTTQAIGAKMDGKCGWRNHKQTKIGGTACKWAGITNTIEMAAKRLKGSTTQLVQIEHMDALRLIERYKSSEETLMYLDPPYLRSTRKSGRLYVHEMTEADQRRMLELILECKGKIILSGYQSGLYDECLKGWHKNTHLTRTTSAEIVQEVIWMNYQPPARQESLLDLVSGEEGKPTNEDRTNS